MFPKKLKKTKMNLRESTVIKCPGHLAHVRKFSCTILGRAGHQCSGVTEPHHVISRGAGGGDEQVVPLCSLAHQEGHRIGWDTFALKYSTNLDLVAAHMWKVSPAAKRYLAKTQSNASQRT